MIAYLRFKPKAFLFYFAAFVLILTGCGKDPEVKPDLIPSFTNAPAAIEAYAGDEVILELENFDNSDYTIELNGKTLYTAASTTGTPDKTTTAKFAVPWGAGSGTIELVKGNQRIAGPQFTYKYQYVTHTSWAGFGTAMCLYADDAVITYDPFGPNKMHIVRLAGFKTTGDPDLVYSLLGTKSSDVTFPDGWAVKIGYPFGMTRNAAGDEIVGYTYSRTANTFFNLATVQGADANYYDGNAYENSFTARIIDVEIDTDENIYTVEAGRPAIKRVNTEGLVEHAGSAAKGLVDGAGTAAKFTSIRSIAIDANDNLFVADSNSVRMITPAGTVTTVAGALQGGDAIGAAKDARFNVIKALAFDKDGLLYILDAGNKSIKVLDLEQKIVTTLKGAQLPDLTEMYSLPIVVDGHKNVFVLSAAKERYMYTSIREDNIPAANLQAVMKKKYTQSEVLVE